MEFDRINKDLEVYDNTPNCPERKCSSMRDMPAFALFDHRSIGNMGLIGQFIFSLQLGLQNNIAKQLIMLQKNAIQYTNDRVLLIQAMEKVLLARFHLETLEHALKNDPRFYQLVKREKLAEMECRVLQKEIEVERLKNELAQVKGEAMQLPAGNVSLLENTQTQKNPMLEQIFQTMK